MCVGWLTGSQGTLKLRISCFILREHSPSKVPSSLPLMLPAPVQATFIFHCPYAVYYLTGPPASTLAPLQPILHV